MREGRVNRNGEKSTWLLPTSTEVLMFKPVSSREKRASNAEELLSPKRKKAAWVEFSSEQRRMWNSEW